MSQKSILPLALLVTLCPIEAFGPHQSLSSSCHHDAYQLYAQRGQVDKKRRFLQQAHPVAPPKPRAFDSVQDWDAPKKPAAIAASQGSGSGSGRTRMRPPLQTSKSIEELEAILEKRYGTAASNKPKKFNEDGEFSLAYEDDDEWEVDEQPVDRPRGAAVLRSKRVVDPWERMKAKSEENVQKDEVVVKKQRYNRDEVMLNRVRANQNRLLDKKDRSKRDETYDVSIDDKDYYDQDDEGYESSGISMISPRPVGGRGKSSSAASLSAGIFSRRDDASSRTDRARPTTAAPAKDEKKQKKPKQKEPQSEALLDEDGNPMYLTLEQAERIVESILSNDQDSTSSNANPSNSDKIEWQDIGITNPTILSNLKSMICPAPLEVQIKSVPPIIAGNDVLLSTHTGSGKTLAFLAPIAQNIMVNPSQSTLPKSLVVAPGRELASQIVSVAQQLFEGTDLTVGMVIGGTSYARNVEMLRSKRPDVVVGTPGRVAELVLGRGGDKGGKLKLSALQTIVLDEFDALLQYTAHKEPTAEIMEAIERQHGQSLQRVLCSATALDIMSPQSGSTSGDSYLRPGYAHASIDEADLLVTSGVKSDGKRAHTSARVSKTTIHGTVHVPSQRLQLETLRRVLNSEPVVQQALIFVDSPRRVDIVIEKLAQMGIVAAPLHGGATSGKNDRAEVSKALREGFVGIVVATEMAARGLDAPYLTHVINLDLPTDASHYAHRSGRCGRGGRPGVAVSITCNEKEKGVPKRFAKELGITMYNVEARGGQLRIVR